METVLYYINRQENETFGASLPIIDFTTNITYNEECEVITDK